MQLCSPVFSQNSSNNDDNFPSVTMPVITTPSIGSGSYVPGDSHNRAQTSSKTSDLGKTSSSQNTINQNDEQKKSSFVSSITAQDLTTLSGMGLLDSFNASMGISTESARSTLEKFLSQMEDLKTKNADAAEEYKTKTSSDTPAAGLVVTDSESKSEAATSKTPVARLLRFNVNGYDLLKTCAKIYISSVQNDGTFLVTGDRRYMSDAKLRTETFHILFKPQKESNGFSNYTAAVSVTQDYLNTYSFVYQLSQKENLSATRIGNLVTMRVNEPNWQFEFLVDLGDK